LSAIQPPFHVGFSLTEQKHEQSLALVQVVRPTVILVARASPARHSLPTARTVLRPPSTVKTWPVIQSLSGSTSQAAMSRGCRYVEDLELVAKASEADEWMNRIEYLPF